MLIDTMFEGEKTYVFRLGLIILGLASVGLFSVIWYSTAMGQAFPDLTTTGGL